MQPMHHPPPPVLELAYVSFQSHDRNYESWAFLYNGWAYLTAFKGDVWYEYQVLISSPIREANNPLIQRILDKFYPGWGSKEDPAETMGDQLLRIGYRLPQPAYSINYM